MSFLPYLLNQGKMMIGFNNNAYQNLHVKNIELAKV
jgi:hypothetical protein